MSNKTSPILKAMIVYILFGLLWVYFSDIIINIFMNSENYIYLEKVNNYFFVIVTSILVYFLLKKLSFYSLKEKDNLEKTKELLEKIIENAPLIIFWKNKDGIYLGCNTEFLDLMNLHSKGDLLGKKDTDFAINENKDFMDDDMIVMTTKQPKLNYIETITPQNKEPRILNTSKVPLIDENGIVIGVLGVIQDITEQTANQKQIKSQEELLIQQSKLASMGEMIANIAHQWRQPLSVISTLSTGMKLQKEMNVSNEEYEKQALEMINENAQYLSKTIDDFKNFFKKDNKKIMMSTDSILEKTTKLVYSRLKTKNVELISNIEHLEFKSYESEIIQILINMINNAIDAFENQELEKQYIFINMKKNHNNLDIEIKDNAGGIPKNVITRIFEPYFTTKEEKQGTGIGLYMSNEIVIKHLKGMIQASTVNYDYLNNNYTGASFIISFPISNED